LWPRPVRFPVVRADLLLEVVASEVGVCGLGVDVDELLPADICSPSPVSFGVPSDGPPCTVILGIEPASSKSVEVHCGHIDSPTA